MAKEEIGQRIRKLRKLLGLSQKEFAEILGIHPMTLSRYELGKIQPTEKILQLIAIRFEVNLDWLKKGEGEPFFEERGRMSPKWAIFSREMQKEIEELAKKIVIGHLEWLCSEEEQKKISRELIQILFLITIRHLKDSYNTLSFTLEDFIKWSLGTHPLQKVDENKTKPELSENTKADTDIKENEQP